METLSHSTTKKSNSYFCVSSTKKIFLLSFFGGAWAGLFSQDIIVQNAPLPEAEIHAAINHLDPNNIVIAAQSGFKNINGSNLSIYYTKDFGNTWNKSNYHGVPVGYKRAGDPVLAFDTQGNVLLINLAITDDINGDMNTILSKSNDGGATWQHITTVVSGITDKPWLAIDRFGTSIYEGNIYVPVMVQNTTNNVIIHSLNNNYEVDGAIVIPDGTHIPSVVVKKNGLVFTSTIDLSITNKIFVQKYSNGGTNLLNSELAASFPDKFFDAPDISLRFQPTPYLAIDNSGGQYDGRLYLSYTASEIIDDNYFNVFLTYSDDDGLTWSTPKTIGGNQNKVQQFYSSLYVNENGVLIMDWYDRKNFSNTNKLTDFYMGISNDGGNSFTEIKLNSLPSDFDYVIQSSNNFGIGEYHQLVATKSKAISFWSDGRTSDGHLNIYMAKVDINNPSSIEHQSVISDKINISMLYPMPVENVAYSNIELFEAASVKYEIINSIGQKLREIEWINYSAGKHLLKIDFDLPTGTYFIKIITDKGYFKNIKLIKK